MSQGQKTEYKIAKNDSVRALDEILEKYRKISTKYIEKFACVYYPIAIVEMELEEETFEDFEVVQYYILYLVACGFKDCDVIAETLGLTSAYVRKIFRLLKGYGHIDTDGNITSLAIQSFYEGKKIVHPRVKQKFQLDALNGTLLKVEQIVTDTMLNDRSKTNIIIGHLDYMANMRTNGIIHQLKDVESTQYIAEKGGLLNVNVRQINDVQCVDLKYARSYLMKLKDCEEPIIFAKRYDESKKSVKERFSWLPFSVEKQEIIDKYEFEQETPISSEIARKYVGQFYEMLFVSGEGVKVANKITSALRRVYKFEEKGINITEMRNNHPPIVYVKEQAFRVYRTWIINFLIGLAANGEYLVTNENLYGNIILIRTESALLRNLADLLTSKIQLYGKIDVTKRIKSKFIDYEGDDLIEKIFVEVKKIS